MNPLTRRRLLTDCACVMGLLAVSGLYATGDAELPKSPTPSPRSKVRPMEGERVVQSPVPHQPLGGAPLPNPPQKPPKPTAPTSPSVEKKKK